MTIRFQADADLNRIIVLAATRREPNLDFRTAEAAGLAGVKDPEVLAVAAAEGRVLVSHDQKTMPRHFAQFIAHTPSPGLLLIPQHLPVAAAVEDILMIWFASKGEEWTNCSGPAATRRIVCCNRLFGGQIHFRVGAVVRLVIFVSCHVFNASAVVQIPCAEAAVANVLVQTTLWSGSINLSLHYLLGRREIVDR